MNGTCEHCGTTFDMGPAGRGRGRPRRFCSKACTNAASRARVQRRTTETSLASRIDVAKAALVDALTEYAERRRGRLASTFVAEEVPLIADRAVSDALAAVDRHAGLL